MDKNGFEIDKEIFASLPDIPEEKEEQTPKKAEKPKKEKKKKQSRGTKKSLFVVLIIVVISVLIAGFAIVAGADYLGIGFGRGKPCVMEIDEGSSTAQIAEALKETGTIKMPLLFRLYSKIKHYDSLYKYGVFTFNNELGYEGIADMLMEGGAKANTKTVTIPEMASLHSNRIP